MMMIMITVKPYGKVTLLPQVATKHEAETIKEVQDLSGRQQSLAH